MVASWIAQDVDSETFVFRKFDWLSARNLLHLQAELVDLEFRLKSLDEAARCSNDMDLKQSIRTHEAFITRAAECDADRKRLVLMHSIKAKMKEYQEALVLQSQIAKIEHPRRTVISSFRNYLNGKEGPVLGGRAKYLLDDPHDLIGLRTPTAKDALSRFLQDHWPGGSRPLNSNIKIFPERRVSLVVGTINIAIAAMLLIGSMSSLHYVKSFQARLGTITSFTVGFAFSVGLLTNARTGEIYAATAAYAAVLVVFVSGSLG